MRRTGSFAPAATLALALVLAVPASAQMDHDHGSGDGEADGRSTVSILYSTFAPPRLDVVTGDTVRWSNDSARAHDVLSAGVFDSGNMRIGTTFSRRFDVQGTVSYICSLHPFMTGQVDVHDVLFDEPEGRAGSGKPYVLTGRVAAGVSGSIAISGVDPGGPFPAGAASVNADGTFRVTVTPKATTTYRARIGTSFSPPVDVLVLDRKVSVRAVAQGRRSTLAVSVAPGASGQTVVLQLRLKERFGWWPVASKPLGKDSTATFRVRRGTRVAARVLLTQPDGATELARSRTVHVGPLRRSRG